MLGARANLPANRFNLRRAMRYGDAVRRLISPELRKTSAGASSIKSL
jgi:hypothetical protein